MDWFAEDLSPSERAARKRWKKQLSKVFLTCTMCGCNNQLTDTNGKLRGTDNAEKAICKVCKAATTCAAKSDRCAHPNLKQCKFSDGTTIKMCPDCTRFDGKRITTLQAGGCEKTSHALRVLWEARLKRELDSGDRLSVWFVTLPDDNKDYFSAFQDKFCEWLPSYWERPRHDPDVTCEIVVSCSLFPNGVRVLHTYKRSTGSDPQPLIKSYRRMVVCDLTMKEKRGMLHTIDGRW